MVQIQSKCKPGYFPPTKCFQGSNDKLIKSEPLSWLEPGYGATIDKGLERRSDEWHCPADRILQFHDHLFNRDGCSFCCCKEFRTED